MKKALLAVFLFTGILSSQASVLIPLDPVPATMTEQFVITLPADMPLAAVYYVSIEGLAFESEDQYMEFCQRAGDRLIVVRGNFTEHKMFISPQPNMAGADWTIADWNTYLEGRAAAMEALYHTMVTE